MLDGSVWENEDNEIEVLHTRVEILDVTVSKRKT